MRRTRFVLLFAVITALLFLYPVSSGYPCSSFVIRKGDTVLFGKNLDLYTDKGLLVINKRNIRKQSLILPPENPVRWTSKYGSITFNQVGKEFPYGGMNETGLVVEIMQLDRTAYPASDDRPALLEIQYIQYILDTCSNVEEVMKETNAVRISQAFKGVHFLVCDSEGNTAVIEFLRGETVSHAGAPLPIPALTNDPYEQSVQIYERYSKLDPEEKKKHSGDSSLDRFARIAENLEEIDEEDKRPGIDTAFDILKNVQKNNPKSSHTVWSIVYDIGNRSIHFRTVDNRNVRTVQISDFDFGDAESSKVYDLSGREKGNLTGEFVEYTTEINRKLIRSVLDIYMNERYIRSISAEEMELLATFPEQFTGGKD